MSLTLSKIRPRTLLNLPQNLPCGLWIALPVLALWPIWLWSARRMLDGSDDPLGIIALVTLLCLVWRDRSQLRTAPRIAWLMVSLLLAGVALLGDTGLSNLVRGLLAVAAVLASLCAVRSSTQAVLAWLGLGLLALPIISSLQFFAGYPLRVITAEASALILNTVGLDVVRLGSSLEVAGKLVMVDAPCSGIQMAWVAYFTACTVAAYLRLSDGQFLRRLPLLGMIVIGGNIVRNTVLVIKESELVQWPTWTHEAVGLLTFTGVCLLVLWQMARRSATPNSCEITSPLTNAAQRTPTQYLTALALGFVSLMLLTLGQNNIAPEAATKKLINVEWPLEFDGRAIRPLALTTVEQKFAENFPGAIARFTDEHQLITLRHVTAATRKLHPAADCYRGLGYRIASISLEKLNANAHHLHGLQRCFIASKGARQLRVCEYIEDTSGHTFTDASAWYWAAIAKESQGPWLAATVAQVLRVGLD